ncbi:MAG: PID-CTERM protein-sorting domain-containing protein [Balneola sp.]
MKHLVSLLFSLFLILILVTVVQAQPGLPGAPSQAPIDGGLGLLAAAGGAYAIKKLRDKKKNQDLEE